MEFGIEKWAMFVMKSGKRHMTDGMELPNQDKIRTLAERETWTSWRLTPSNKWKLKKKLRKNISGELENYTRQNSLVETLSKEEIPGLYHSLDIPDPLWSGSEMNLSK